MPARAHTDSPLSGFSEKKGEGRPGSGMFRATVRGRRTEDAPEAGTDKNPPKARKASEDFLGEGMWESNPPKKLLTPITGFEDRGAHQHPSTPMLERTTVHPAIIACPVVGRKP